MKKILFAATVLCMMGCQNKPTNSTPALDPSNMDTSVAPNESFYQYATGGWQAKNPLKPEHSSYNMFNVLSDNNEIRINELFTQMTKENPAKGTVNQKIADLYKLGLDSVRLNKEGAAPVKAELKTILSLDKKEQLTPILSVMQLTSSSPLFSFGPQADLKDSKVNALYIGQSGIGMGDRDYYLDAENESIREAYKTYLNRLFTLAGLEESEAGKATDAVMRIETELAKNMRSNVELRDIQRMYNPDDDRRSEKELRRHRLGTALRILRNQSRACDRLPARIHGGAEQADRNHSDRRLALLPGIAIPQRRSTLPGR